MSDNEEQINKIIKDYPKDEPEKDATKTTLTIVKNDKETDFSKVVREGVIHLSSFSMFNEDKRKRFEEDLKKDETINNYIDDQLYTKFLKTNNPHFKCAIIYSYLYMKHINSL